LAATSMRAGTPFATIGATGLDMARGQFPMNGLPGEKTHSPSPRHRAGTGMTSTKQTRNPHRPSPQPRGFVLERLSPDGIRKPSPSQSFSR
jgi:hypothetical protein